MGGKTENINGSGFRKLNETFVRLVGNLSKFVFESVELMGGKTESVSFSVSVSGFRKLNETFVRLFGNLSKFVFESVELMGGKTESVSVIIRSGRDHD